MVYVVGIGPGDEKYMTVSAVELVGESDIIVGGDRQLETAKSILTDFGIKEDSFPMLVSIKNGISRAIEIIGEMQDRNIVVLASGDPTLYGIADYIIRNTELDVYVEPGISSISYAFSRFGKNMNDVYITSSHGRNPDFDFLFCHKKIAMVTDSKIGPFEIYLEAEKRGKRYNYYIGENLSYTNERVYRFSSGEAEKMREINFEMCVLIMIEED